MWIEPGRGLGVKGAVDESDSGPHQLVDELLGGKRSLQPETRLVGPVERL
jgi:hypothetical protein